MEGNVMAKREKTKRRLELSPGAEDPADRLFAEVAGILEQARRQTVRSVNTYMVTAYWLVGWRIVEAEQGGETRAGYGQRLIEGLSVRLTKRFGRGFSVQSLWNFRELFLTYRERTPRILSTLRRESDSEPFNAAILSTAWREFARADESAGIGDTASSELAIRSHTGMAPVVQPGEPGIGFHPNLGWSHYRALMRVDKPAARQFYEDEAATAGWSVRELQRQIGSLYYERLLASRDKRGMIREQRQTAAPDPLAVIKDPYVLEFLDLPEDHRLNETELEARLLSHLQGFLLELGHGFALIGRQQRLTLDGDHFYADLVFYHVRLKCFVIIDLKTEKLTHADLGQMQLYVNYYDREVKGADDNPTLGLILCTDKNEAVVRYVLGEGQEQIFASRYRMVLPTEEELAAEVRREMAALGLDDPPGAAAAATSSTRPKTKRAKSRRIARR
jgi:predicted nuclease of restriction endonuclease-like (RecB) superfamily